MSEQCMRDDSGFRNDAFACKGGRDALAGGFGVGGVAHRVYADFSPMTEIRNRVEDCAVRFERATFVIDFVAEGIDRTTEANCTRAVEANEFAQKRNPAVELRKFIVFN